MSKSAWVLALAISVSASAAEIAGLTRDCERGKAAACAEAGAMYRDGAGARKDIVQAAVFYVKACALVDPSADPGYCEDAGRMIGAAENLRGGTDKLKGTFAAWASSCEAGRAMNCNFLGLVYQMGAGFEKDFDKSRAAYARGCEGGAVSACSNAAYAYLQDPRDPAKVVHFLEKACDKSIGGDCTLLGTMIENGDGTKKDVKRAAGLYRRACDLGAGDGCTHLAGVHLGDDLGKADKPKALALAQQGCDLSDGVGCVTAALLVLHGDGVGKDLLTAVIDFKKACNLGETRGCLGLARIYNDDKPAAKKLFEQACAKIGSCDDFRGLMEEIDAAADVKKSH